MTLLLGMGGWLLYALALIGLLGWGELFLRHVLRIDSASSRTLRYSFSIGAGIVLFSTLMLYTTALGGLTPLTLRVLWMILIVSGLWRCARLIRAAVRDSRSLQNATTLILVLGVIAAIALPLLVLPPAARDGLVYHLEVPRQMLLQQGFTQSANTYSYFPMGIEMLYLFSLGLLPASSAQFAHFGFLLLTVLAIVETFGYSVKKKWPPALLLGVAAMVTVPTFWLDASWAYIDVAWAYFSYLLAAGCYLYFKRGDQASLAITAFIGGFYLAIKYPGFYFFAVLVLGILITVLLCKAALRGFLKAGLLFLLTFLIATAPYFARNVILTGNPLFPFFTGIIPTRSEVWSPAHEVALVNGLLHQYGNQAVPQALRFVNFFVAAFNPVLEQPELYDGVLGPFLLLWIPPLFFFKKRSAARLFVLVLILAYSLAWSYSLRQARFLLPIIPIILLAFLDWFQEETASRRKQVLCSLFLAGILAFNLGVLGPAVKSRWPAVRDLFGQLDQDDHLAGALPVYACQKFINDRLPGDARIWVMLTGNENFYLQREYRADYVIEDYAFHRWLESCRHPEEISRGFSEEGITHLLVRTDLLFNPLLYLDKPGKFALAVAFFQSNRLLFQANGFAVYELRRQVPAGG
jgi:hypothetical protein